MNRVQEIQILIPTLPANLSLHLRKRLIDKNDISHGVLVDMIEFDGR